jgi:uncharacterized oligopeptide transporter (OPT) family protein
VGDRVVIDRPVTDPRTDRPLAGSLSVAVRKEALPPYAPRAVLLAALLATLLTLLETYLPKRLKRWVPSATGLGLGFVITGTDSISMFLGALLAYGVEKRWPQKSEEYTLASASGIMAGASLAGIVIIVFSQVFKVLVPS